MTQSADNSNPVDITFFVACYNERDGIAGTLDTIKDAMLKQQKSYEVIIIDDASKDNSVALIKDWLSRNSHLPFTLIINEKNQGLARNYRTAARLGTGAYYRLVCGDNVEPGENFAIFSRMLGKAEVILPYFTVFVGKPFLRVCISKVYTHIVNLLSGYRIKYYNSILVKRELVAVWESDNTGFGFLADLVTSLLDQGRTYTQVPATSLERTGGSSTALTVHNFRTIAKMFRRILLRRLTRKKKGVEIPADG
jgi:glycosyltransferase involved in cell wall biosynthesis